ncbi:MAG: metalloregulator ArsR/SmtB family transcription factor [Rhodobacteraceae bacterium]|nr:metalloregulator ArsR/SmtB family transcription factor [Paracoccaceae bacterium]
MDTLPTLFAALSDPTRLGIVERLLTAGPQSAGELGDIAAISAPAISRHLKVLREAAVIRQEIDGPRRIYSVAPEALRAISDWTLTHRAFWDASLDRLDAAVRKLNEETS